VVHAEALDLVQRDEHSGKEEFVFLFQRQRETVDDGTENFEKLGYTVEPFRFVDELEEDIIN
jgi:hypothetical protein